jgi:hypothetical protein
MMGFRGFLFCAVLSGTSTCATAAFSFTDFGKGRPVTFQDLVGKTFCWGNGNTVLYKADGQFQNNHGGHGTWVIVEPGVLKLGNSYRQVEVLSDGRLHRYAYCLICMNHDKDLWATPCN